MSKFYTGIGSRAAPKEILSMMEDIGEGLANLGYVLRSGAADGSDAAFARGAYQAGEYVEEYLPWKGFNDSKSPLYLGNIGKEYEAKEIAKQFHPAWDRLKQGGKKLMTRNVYQLLGQDLNTPSRFVVCWTKDGRATGGTGNNLRTAIHYNIPIFNLYFDEDIDKVFELID